MYFGRVEAVVCWLAVVGMAVLLCRAQPCFACLVRPQPVAQQAMHWWHGCSAEFFITLVLASLVMTVGHSCWLDGVIVTLHEASTQAARLTVGMHQLQMFRNLPLARLSHAVTCGSCFLAAPLWSWS